MQTYTATSPSKRRAPGRPLTIYIRREVLRQLHEEALRQRRTCSSMAAIILEDYLKSSNPA